MEPKVGGAKADPTGRQAKMERKDQRLEAEPQHPLETPQGSKTGGLEDLLSSVVMVVRQHLTGSQ